jgi:hypothetical protein
MSKFDKLCETVGLEKISLDYPDNIEPFYPDFSVTAQLELWKYLLRQDLNIQYYYVDKKYGFVLAEDDENIFEDKKWEEALATLTTFLINTKRVDKFEVKELLIRWIDDWN